MRSWKSICGTLVGILALTRPESALATTVKTVIPAGSGDFTTVQAAIDSVPTRNPGRVIIEIAPGHYDEHLTIPKDKPLITLRGMGNTPAEVWIGGVTKGSGVIVTARADNFRCEHLTLEDQSPSTTDQTTSAIAFNGMQQVIEDCQIRGRHNTMFVGAGARVYLHFSDIVGTGDIVYGPGSAFIDTCDVFVTNVWGNIAAPNTPRSAGSGLVFVDCHFFGSTSDRNTLMRPWGPDGAAAFIRCSMDPHFSRNGWLAWGGRELTCRAQEFGSTTSDEKPLDLSARPAWVQRLSPDQASHFTLSSVYGGWDPHAGAAP